MITSTNKRTTVIEMKHPKHEEAVPRKDSWSSLLQQVAIHKDESAFAELFEHYAPLLKGFYLSNMPIMQEQEAEELAQEVMCKVWLKAESFDPSRSSANTWIYTVARNARIDYFRKNARHNQQTQALEAEDIWDEESESQPFVLLNEARNKSDVSRLLAVIPSEQRQCLVKMYMEGKSHAELAKELDLPLGTVKSRIRLGLKHLQNQVLKQER